MTNLRTTLMLVAAAVLMAMAMLSGCGGTKSTDMSSTTTDMGPAVMDGEHGSVVDYFTAMPLSGFTVTNGVDTVTTGADGIFLFPAPALGTTVSPVASGPSYGTLYMPEGTVAGPAIDHGTVPMATLSNIALEQSILGNDTSKAVVHIAILRRGACPTLNGGTLTVNAPAGAKVAYFTTAGLPTGSSTIDIVPNKPAAIVYDVTPGADLDLTLNVPGCTQAAPGAIVSGLALTGKVPTVANEPGDNTSALELVVE